MPCCDSVWVSDEYYGQGVIAGRLAAAEEVWWYTALTVASPDWWTAHGYPPAIGGDNTQAKSTAVMQGSGEGV